MKNLAALAIGALCIGSTLNAQETPLPIIDMHLHALPASVNGPPPIAICAPPIAWPARDPAKPWAAIFLEELKKPKCEKPIWGPVTDKEVMDQTLDVLQKYNIYGVTSGSLVDEYMNSGGERILPGLQFSFFNKDLDPDKVKGSSLD